MELQMPSGTLFRGYMTEVLKIMKLGRDNPDFVELPPDKILKMLDKGWKKADKEIEKYLDTFKVA